jgi:hypothetical protein
MELNFKCEHCGKQFAKERTLFSHVCERKRRHQARNERHVQMGFWAFCEFYKSVQPTSVKTFADFVSSSYYTAFVKFGSFLVNTNPIYPERFVQYVIKNGIKLDHWCKDSLYEAYLVETIKTEPADGAIQRTIDTMLQWADKNSSLWEHYFCYVNLTRAVHDIREGLVSPWIILNTKSGKEMLQKFSDEQLEMVGLIIDLPYWKRHFQKRTAEVELVKAVIHEAKIP